MPFLPSNQQRQSTEGNIYRQTDSKLTEQCNNRGRFKQTLLPLHTFAEMHFINNWGRNDSHLLKKTEYSELPKFYKVVQQCIERKVKFLYRHAESFLENRPLKRFWKSIYIHISYDQKLKKFVF